MPDTSNAVIIEPQTSHRRSIIWLHGLGANGHDFEPIVPELRLPADFGIRYIFPNAPHMPVTINGGMRMPAWYDVRRADLRQEEDAASIRASAELIDAFVGAEKDRGITTDNILLAGFSQGGAIALHCSLRLPECLAGILALSTYLPLADTLETEAAEANRNTPILMCHGTSDPVIPFTAGQQTCEQLQNAGYKVDFQGYPMGHAVCMEEIQAIGQWLKHCFS